MINAHKFKQILNNYTFRCMYLLLAYSSPRYMGVHYTHWHNTSRTIPSHPGHYIYIFPLVKVHKLSH